VGKFQKAVTPKVFEVRSPHQKPALDFIGPFQLFKNSACGKSRFSYKSPLEGGSVNRCFKTPVITANAGHRKGLSRKLDYGKIAALFLHIPTSRG
jgi:hypothetical protein